MKRIFFFDLTLHFSPLLYSTLSSFSLSSRHKQLPEVFYEKSCSETPASDLLLNNVAILNS